MLKNFTAAPHRVMFFGGALQAIAVLLWWTMDLASRYGIIDQPISWAVAPGAAHVFLMIYSMLPFFMFGFLMTTFPRWMAGKEITPKLYVTAFGLMFLGAVSFYVGMAFSVAILVVASRICLGWMGRRAVCLAACVDGYPTRRQTSPHRIGHCPCDGVVWSCEFSGLAAHRRICVL